MYGLLNSRSLNRSRKKFQKRKLSQQLSITPLKKRKINWWWPHPQDVFFPSSSVQVKQKSAKIRFLLKSVSAYHYQSGKSCAVPLNWQFTPGSTSCLMENGHCILRREEWPCIFTNGKKLKKTIPLFEDREPELRTMDNKVTGED